MPSLCTWGDNPTTSLQEDDAEVKNLIGDFHIRLSKLESHVRNTMQKQIDEITSKLGNCVDMIQDPASVDSVAEGSLRSVQTEGQRADSTPGSLGHQSPSEHLKDSAQSLTERLEASYSLQPSIWDAGILIGIKSLGIQTSIFLGITMFINVVAQAVLCYVCWFAFYAPDIDNNSEFLMRLWRLNSAHDVANVQTMRPLSLASRLCSEDESLSLAAQQQNIFDAISGYRPPNATFVGEVLCLICLLCFWNVLWSDCKQTIKFGESVYPALGKHTRITTFGNEIQVQSISPSRGALCWTIAFFRLVVFVNTGMVGTLWLTQTVSVGDLLLNAVALELILCVDELIYAGLAPASVKAYVENCAPLKTWHMKHLFGIDVQALVGILLVFVLLPVVYFWKVHMTSTLLENAEKALCGGTQNFVYGTDALGMIHIHDGMAQPDDVQFTIDGFDETDFRVLALEEVIAGVQRDKWQYAMYAPSVKALRNQISMDPGSAMTFTAECKDILTNEGCQKFYACDKYRKALRSMTGQMSLEWCSDVNVELHCYGQSRTALMAKALCPITCGCLSGFHGIYVVGGPAKVHCPPTCDDNAFYVAAFREKRDECPEDEDGNSSMWQLWMAEAKQILPDAIRDPLEKQGCLALTKNVPRGDLCEGFTGTRPQAPFNLLKPLARVCPRACGCTPGHNSHIVSYYNYIPDQCDGACTCNRWKHGTSIAANCVSGLCKNVAVSRGELTFYPVSSIEDVNEICACPSLAMVEDVLTVNRSVMCGSCPGVCDDLLFDFDAHADADADGEWDGDSDGDGDGDFFEDAYDDSDGR